MKESNFNKLYKMIMQSNGFGGAIACAIPGQQWPALKDNEPVLDAINNEPVYWEMFFPEHDCIDAITGELIPERSTNVLSYSIFPPSSKMNPNVKNKSRVYVKIDTYRNAYETKDQAMIAKLQSMGLQEGIPVD